MENDNIMSLSYNAVFKAVISNNEFLINKIIQAILDYWKIDIDVLNKKLIVKKNELSVGNYKDKQLICDYIIEIDSEHEINIEINRKLYPGLYERNVTYVFQIFYNHFKAGSSYKEFKKFKTFQVNFNKYKNPNNKRINKFLLLDVDDVDNTLTNNIQIMNIDIESCFYFVYNNPNKEEIHNLERIAGMLFATTLSDVSKMLGSGILSMEEKEKLLKSINEVAKDKDVQAAVKLEDDIEYRFEATRDEALEEGIQIGIEQGIEQTLKDNIINMLKEKIDMSIISKVTGKDIDYITNLSKEIR